MQGLGGAPLDHVQERLLPRDPGGQLGFDAVVPELLDRLCPRLLLEVDATRVAFVAPLALPGQCGIVAEAVEPAADEGVPGLELVVEELEGEVLVHRLDPEGQAGQLDGQGIDVDAVKATLHDVPLEPRTEPGLELLVLGPAGEKLLGEAAFGRLPLGQSNERRLALLADPAVLVQAGKEGVGQEAEARHEERAGAHGRIADLEREDLLGALGRPRCGRRILVRLALRSDRRVEGQEAKRPLHSGDGELGPRVEGPCALACASPTDQEPLSRKHHPLDEARGRPLDGSFVLAESLRLLRARPGYKLSDTDGTAGPLAGAVSSGLVGVGFLDRDRDGFVSPGRIRRFRFPFFFVLGLSLGLVLGLAVTVVLPTGHGFPLDLQLLHESGDGRVVHAFEPRKRQQGLVAQGEECHGLYGTVQLVVQETLVEDADVLRREVGEVHGGFDPRAPAALAHLHAAPAEKLQEAVDEGVARRVAAARVLEGSQGAADGIGRGGVAGGEEVAAVAGYGEGLVVRPLVDETEEGEHTRPSAQALAQALEARRAAGALEEFPQALETVGGVVGGVVAGQEVPRLGEQDDNHAHDHAGGGDIDVPRRHLGAHRFEPRAVLLDQHLDGPADALPQLRRQLGLAAAGGLDGGEEWARLVWLGRGEPSCRQQSLEGRDLGTGLALLEPETRVPFGPGVEVEAGVDEAPLARVREKGDLVLGRAQPVDDAGDGPPATADAQARDVVDEDREEPAVGRVPDAPGFHGLAGQGPDRPPGVHVGPALPAGAVRCFEAAHSVEDDIHEGCFGILGAGVQAHEVAAEAVNQMAGQRRWLIREVLRKARGGDEQPPVLE